MDRLQHAIRRDPATAMPKPRGERLTFALRRLIGAVDCHPRGGSVVRDAGDLFCDMHVVAMDAVDNAEERSELTTARSEYGVAQLHLHIVEEHLARCRARLMALADSRGEARRQEENSGVSSMSGGTV